MLDSFPHLCYDVNMSQMIQSKSVEKYGINHIRPYHREIARRLTLGQRDGQIKKDLGISDSRFSIIINSPLFINELKKLEAIRDRGVGNIQATLTELAPIALEQVERTMYYGKTDKIKLEAAESLLDRAGIARINKTQISGEVNHNHSSYTTEELRNLVLERVKRMKAREDEATKLLADAQATEVEYDMVSGPEDVKEDIPFGQL